MRRLNYGPDVPTWAVMLFEEMQNRMGDRPQGPTQLYTTTTANLPPATKWPGSVMFDSTRSLEVVSDGTTWRSLSATATYDPPSLAAGAQDALQTLTVTGAVLGDTADASFSLDLQGLSVRAYVSAADTVKYVFANPTAGAVNLASGTVTVRVRK